MLATQDGQVLVRDVLVLVPDVPDALAVQDVRIVLEHAQAVVMVTALVVLVVQLLVLIIVTLTVKMVVL